MTKYDIENMHNLMYDSNVHIDEVKYSPVCFRPSQLAPATVLYVTCSHRAGGT